MLKQQRFWKDFIVKSENVMGKTICISKSIQSCYKNETYVVYKASKHVYFSDNHESIMLSYHAMPKNVIL